MILYSLASLRSHTKCRLTVLPLHKYAQKRLNMEDNSCIYNTANRCPFAKHSLWLLMAADWSLYFWHREMLDTHLFAAQCRKTRRTWYAVPDLQKSCGFPPLLLSHSSPFTLALDVWWSNPDIFYILMQNKHGQITRIHPTSTNSWKSLAK